MIMTSFRDIVLGACLGSIVTAAAASLGDVSTLDPLKLSPQYYKLRFENSQVRVLEYHLKPGVKEVMHSHPARVLFALADATVRSTLALKLRRKFLRSHDSLFAPNDLTVFIHQVSR